MARLYSVSNGLDKFFSALDNPNLSYFITDLIVAITPSFKRCFGALCTKKLSKDISIDCGSLTYIDKIARQIR